MLPSIATVISSNKRLWTVLVILLGLLIFIKVMSDHSAAQSPTTESPKERVFENAIPENAPIKIKIKKEKEQIFKDLTDEKWVREFELEVKNTGEKPIYFLFLDLITDDWET